MRNQITEYLEVTGHARITKHIIIIISYYFVGYFARSHLQPGSLPLVCQLQELIYVNL